MEGDRPAGYVWSKALVACSLIRFRGWEEWAWLGSLLEGGELDRAIRIGKLHALLRFHIRPIDVVVFHGSRARPVFEGGFPLRCFQRLSCPDLATQLCRWHDNWSTRDPSTPVLSY